MAGRAKHAARKASRRHLRPRNAAPFNGFMGAYYVLAGAPRPACETCGEPANHWLGVEKTRWFCEAHFHAHEQMIEDKQAWLRRRHPAPPAEGGTHGA